MKFVVYNKETGEIRNTGFADLLTDALIQGDDNHSVLVDVEANDLDHYVVNGKIEERPTLEVHENVIHSISPDAITLYPVPLGTTIRYKDGEAVTDGTPFGFQSDTAGIWEFEFEPPFPFKPKKVTVHAF